MPLLVEKIVRIVSIGKSWNMTNPPMLNLKQSVVNLSSNQISRSENSPTD